MYIDKIKALDIISKIDSSAQIYEHLNQLSIIISKEKMLDVLRELKTNPDTLFDMCIDITAIDWMKKPQRFEVVYNLYSMKLNHRLRIKVALEGDYPVCPSVTSIWESANWYERETYDMYGIKFEGHPFLRRFYMTEDFKDPETKEPLYPLRKDFPLMGIPNDLPLPQYPEKYGDLE
ncbi:MAG TPA: NADH-quinone oxidoreductase subunit C [Candidatus Kapabacteria bacterium]|nr:NADH-quinone oxidoreductase subunit C [Candidatus Kapabacteria bacterium]HOV91891.1 NADH-quinone oxidoreductase subunit C [Candidatus Kapabacteria bacterium]